MMMSIRECVHVSLVADQLVDLPKRGTLLRFSERDSEALEKAFQANRERIETAWWQQEAECFRPVEEKKEREDARPQKNEVDEDMGNFIDGSVSWNDYMRPGDKQEEIGVPVRAGRYEVILSKRILKPSYCPDTSHRVIRGSWFVEKGPGEWVPLREALADQIDQAYRSSAWKESSGLPRETQSDGRTASKLELTAVQKSSSHMHVLWYGPNEAFLIIKESGFAWLRSPSSYRLRRGYRSPESSNILSKEADLEAEKCYDAAAMTSPTHLVLIVHGIGQTLQSANIAADAHALWSGISQVQQSISSNKKHQKKAMKSGEGSVKVEESASSDFSREANVSDHQSESTTRVDVLPVQWRKTMDLKIDKLADALKPPGIPALRTILHSTAVEVLHYLTPMHRSAMIASLITSMNAVYSRFIARNPSFCGPITVVAHSLGSVLCWDVFCNLVSSNDYIDVDSPSSNFDNKLAGIDPSPSPQLAWERSKIGMAPLNFSVDNLILLGSPLGCFLALRGIDVREDCGLGSQSAAKIMQIHPNIDPTSDGLPAVGRLYNLYHPFDPVAYRLEPLAFSSEALKGKRTALAPLFSGGKRVHLAVQEIGDKVSGVTEWLWGSKKNVAKKTIAAPSAIDKISGKMSVNDEEILQMEKFPDNERTKSIDSITFSSLREANEDGMIPKGNEQKLTAGYEGATIQCSHTPENMGAEEKTSELMEEIDTFSSIKRVTDGPLPLCIGWPRTAVGHLDFALQEGTVENQYLSAMGAHFLYWSSLDVALFVYRAATGKDVISGELKETKKQNLD